MSRSSKRSVSTMACPPSSSSASYARSECVVAAVPGYLRPLASTPQRIRDLERFILGFDHRQTVRVESKLKELRVPTIVAWGTTDSFFDVWARWLDDTILGVTRRVEFEGARMLSRGAPRKS